MQPSAKHGLSLCTIAAVAIAGLTATAPSRAFAQNADPVAETASLAGDHFQAVFLAELRGNNQVSGLAGGTEVSAVSSALPDAPLPPAQDDGRLTASTSPQSSGAMSAAATVAPIHMKYIPAGWSVQPITPKDKFIIGIKDLVNPINFAAMASSAGYEQLTNGTPNYGTDRGAFGERLGAAAIRETTQGFFTDSVFSPLLHLDPRYYIDGPQHSFTHRVGYAIGNVFMEKNDKGHKAFNGALWLGYASSAALSYTYYPQINKNFRDTSETFAASLGGAALGFVVDEFSSQFLQALHRHKND